MRDVIAFRWKISVHELVVSGHGSKSGRCTGLNISSNPETARNSLAFDWDLIAPACTRYGLDTKGRIKLNMLGNLVCAHGAQMRLPSSNTIIGQVRLITVIVSEVVGGTALFV
jgi:hypothetical protein